MKVLVCGDREWENIGAIYDVLIELSKDTVIIHGSCRGADRIAGEVAKEIGLEVIECPADWKKYGKAAGIIRNGEMLEKNPKLVIAFHNNIKKSRGTKNMVHRAKVKGTKVRIITEGRR